MKKTCHLPFGLTMLYLSVSLALTLAPKMLRAEFASSFEPSTKSPDNLTPEPSFPMGTCYSQTVSRPASFTTLGGTRLSSVRAFQVNRVTLIDAQGDADERNTQVLLSSRDDAFAYFGAGLDPNTTDAVLIFSGRHVPDGGLEVTQPDFEIITTYTNPSAARPIIRTLMVTYDLGRDLPVTFLIKEDLNSCSDQPQVLGWVAGRYTSVDMAVAGMVGGQLTGLGGFYPATEDGTEAPSSSSTKIPTAG